jgi:hypothetical protein
MTIPHLEATMPQEGHEQTIIDNNLHYMVSCPFLTSTTASSVPRCKSVSSRKQEDDTRILTLN